MKKMTTKKEVMQFLENGLFLVSHTNGVLKTGGNLESAKKINKKDIAKFEYLGYKFKIKKVFITYELEKD